MTNHKSEHFGPIAPDDVPEIFRPQSATQFSGVDAEPKIIEGEVVEDGLFGDIFRDTIRSQPRNNAKRTDATEDGTVWQGVEQADNPNNRFQGPIVFVGATAAVLAITLTLGAGVGAYFSGTENRSGDSKPVLAGGPTPKTAEPTEIAVVPTFDENGATYEPTDIVSPITEPITVVTEAVDEPSEEATAPNQTPSHSILPAPTSTAMPAPTPTVTPSSTVIPTSVQEPTQTADPTPSSSETTLDNPTVLIGIDHADAARDEFEQWWRQGWAWRDNHRRKNGLTTAESFEQELTKRLQAHGVNAAISNRQPIQDEIGVRIGTDQDEVAYDANYHIFDSDGTWAKKDRIDTCVARQIAEVTQTKWQELSEDVIGGPAESRRFLGTGPSISINAYLDKHQAKKSDKHIKKAAKSISLALKDALEDWSSTVERCTTANP